MNVSDEFYIKLKTEMNKIFYIIWKWCNRVDNRTGFLQYDSKSKVTNDG